MGAVQTLPESPERPSISAIMALAEVHCFYLSQCQEAHPPVRRRPSSGTPGLDRSRGTMHEHARLSVPPSILRDRHGHRRVFQLPPSSPIWAASLRSRSAVCDPQSTSTSPAVENGTASCGSASSATASCGVSSSAGKHTGRISPQGGSAARRLVGIGAYSSP